MSCLLIGTTSDKPSNTVKNFHDQPPWGGNTITANFATAPDGTLTAFRIQGTGATKGIIRIIF
jgi:hypothetical protein